jgi:hypothetical protein
MNDEEMQRLLALGLNDHDGFDDIEDSDSDNEDSELYL